MQQEALSRREREKRRQRQDILDGAMVLFSQKGYHQVSMQEIAKKSEFATGTLYKFFKNKEALYQSLILELSDQSYTTITTALNQTENPVEKLQAYVRAKGRIFKENTAMVRLYYANARRPGFSVQADIDSELEKRHSGIINEMARIFKTGIQKGVFKQIADPYDLAISLESIVMAYIFLWLEDPDRHPFPENPNAILDILFKGLIDP